MVEIERRMNTPRVCTSRLIHWFGEVKTFTRADQVRAINNAGVPVLVDGPNVASALAYGNHSGADQYSDLVRTKIHGDVTLARAFVFA